MRGQPLGLCSCNENVRHIKVGRWRRRLVESKDWADATAGDCRRGDNHIARIKMQEAAAGADAHERLDAEIQ